MPINPVINNNFAVQETAAAVNQAAVSELKDITSRLTIKRLTTGIL